jgi:hypothetical protein
MKHTDLVTRRHHLLYRLSCLPAKIVAAHDQAHLAELVLYELSQKDCFNFDKAAFFIDNPDFDCLKGMAGVSGIGELDVWQEKENFLKCMEASAFNKAVRAISSCSIEKSGKTVEADLRRLADSLSFRNPGWHVFKIKHGNIGLLVFEKQDEQDTQIVKDHLDAGASLLAFCPII